MNKDQATGKMKGMAGKAQEKLGQATGSTKQRLKGLGKQIAGKAQEAMGDVKGAAKNPDQRR
jgi:uncharacterized protein YjbJ (UPF0337 family)